MMKNFVLAFTPLAAQAAVTTLTFGQDVDSGREFSLCMMLFFQFELEYATLRPSAACLDS